MWCLGVRKVHNDLDLTIFIDKLSKYSGALY